MQLVAYGAQDVYLTGNPQITFFKVVYRRHTNFACEAIEQTFNGSVGFGKRVSCQITRNGDLITKMYLKAQVKYDGTNNRRWVNNLGYSMIKSVELQIGGTKIDKHYGIWMNIWHELARNVSHDKAYTNMLGTQVNPGAAQTQNLFVPLQFFCCRNDGLALPLIALQYHDVRVEFEFNKAIDMHEGVDDNHELVEATLLVDYIYLDSEERKRFAQASHEYLIEQLQYTGVESGVSGTGNKFRLNFNHPCKELVWAVRKSGDVSKDKFVNLTNSNTMSSGVNTVDDAQLQLNGHDRMSKQSGTYFQNVQVRAHHSNTSDNAGINVYSFALNPEEHQPSGTCNFSRIDNAQLNIKLNTAGDVHIFATSYNVLRIMSGMGGLAYSN